MYYCVSFKVFSCVSEICYSFFQTRCVYRRLNYSGRTSVISIHCVWFSRNQTRIEWCIIDDLPATESSPRTQRYYTHCYEYFCGFQFGNISVQTLHLSLYGVSETATIASKQLIVLFLLRFLL